MIYSKLSYIINAHHLFHHLQIGRKTPINVIIFNPDLLLVICHLNLPNSVISAILVLVIHG